MLPFASVCNTIKKGEGAYSPKSVIGTYDPFELLHMSILISFKAVSRYDKSVDFWASNWYTNDELME